MFILHIEFKIRHKNIRLEVIKVFLNSNHIGKCLVLTQAQEWRGTLGKAIRLSLV